MANKSLCSIPDCGKVAIGRGWCGLHYQRWSRHGDPLGSAYPSYGTLCSIPDCGVPQYLKGYCSKHYQRWWRHGDPLASKGGTDRGEPFEFYQNALAYAGDDCLIWPFGRSDKGYGKLWVDGKKRIVSRLICEHVNGPPPTPDHEAAHSCGKGHLGCVAKGHLSWKTSTENKADMLLHDTHSRGERSANAKLTEAAVREIRQLRGKVTQRELSARFGVSQGRISRVMSGKDWPWLQS